MPLATRIIEMARDNDPRKYLVDQLTPWLDKLNMRITGPDVLIGTYDRSGQKTAGGLYVPDNYNEDRVQGKTGLVIQLGPLCNRENQEFLDWFGGNPPKVGDWVGYSIRDAGVSMIIGTNSCVLREFKYIRFVVEQPDLVL
jgi:co-chaperonin GroES (HSP10)